MKNEILTEGMANLMKLLAAHRIKKNLKKVAKMTKDPGIDASVKSFNYYLDKMDDAVKAFCLTSWTHPLCKNYKGRGIKMQYTSKKKK